MKNVIKTTALVITIMLFSSVLLLAQEHSHAQKNDDSNQMMDAKKIDKNNDGIIYECPMKCEAPTDKPGSCSKCGMTLKEISVAETNSKMMKHDKMEGHKKMMKKDTKANCGSSCCGEKKDQK